jgi:hypothetical protein
MILGFTPFTWFHTILSLIALVAGFVVVRDLLTSRTPPTWTAAYIATAVLTSVTGFGFTAPFGPAHVLGIISLVLLAGSIIALYGFHLAGPWRWIYAIAQTLAQYFLVFVLVVQFFRKVPVLHALAPTESEPPFAIAQGVVLVIFVALTIAAAVKFHPRDTLTA